MSSGVLIIGPEDEIIIQAALEAARFRFLPWSVLKAVADAGPNAVLLLGDRKIGVDEVRKHYPPQQMVLGTYRVALSFEEQPAGMFKHISVSSARADKVPGPAVMQVLLEAFGFSQRLCDMIGRGDAKISDGRVWLEEFEPHHMAINVIELENVLQ